MEPNGIDRIFWEAAQITSEGERDAYLDHACAEDIELRRRVEQLLQASAKAESFLESPALHLVTPVDEHPVSESLGTIIGLYKLLDQIGEGGFGVVFMAEQQPLRRKVALKVIKPGMDSKHVIARFEAERQALALMDHPNIARVLDAGTTDAGRPYFVMELVRGISITEFCDNSRLSLPERLELFVTVCQAVQHAHQKGIIHRDLKPSNVLVTLLDGLPVVKVIDFGIAKALGQERLTEKTLFTGFSHMIGTPLYMSPEQAEMSGQDTDTRTDIYALGVLVYELLTGTTPFDKDRLKEASYDEIRRIIREEEPARPSTRIGTLGQAATTVSANRQSEPRRLSQLFRGELDWIVMKALEKDRNRRYDTASSLAADVQRYLDDESVQACPPSAVYRLRKFARKNRMPLIVAAAFVLLLLAGALVSAWQAARATNAERVATRKGQEARTAEAKAKEEAARASRQAYTASIRLMQPAWDSHNMLQLHQLLDETAAFPERGFEWYYWQRLGHLELYGLIGHWDRVNSVSWSPDGQRLATGSHDRTAKVWEAASGRELRTLQGHTNAVWSVAWSPDGQRLATGSYDRTAKVWEVASGRDLRTLKGHTNAIWSVSWSPDGQRLATGSLDGTANLWNATSGLELLTLTGHTSQVQSVSWSPNGQRLATGSKDGTAKVWDAGSGKELRTLKGRSSVWSVSWSPDGQQLATGHWDGTALVWEVVGGRELFSLGQESPVISVSWSPDGHRLATRGADTTTAQVWDLTSGRELITLKGHTNVVHSVSWSPDGKRLATASSDGTAKVWEVASDRELRTLQGHTSAVNAVS
jgi:WD40 repeat protein/serine/threonine protein kinase